MINDLELAELLNAKLCHDLAGPIGAISNGIEFLTDNSLHNKTEENSEFRAKVVNLIDSSSAKATARLNLFRKAFGPIQNTGAEYLSEIIKLIHDYNKDQTDGSRKIEIIWNYANKLLDTGDAIQESVALRSGNRTLQDAFVVSHTAGKLILNMSILCIKSLIFGGKIIIEINEKPESVSIDFTVQGRGAKIDKVDLSILVGKSSKDQLTIRNIMYYYTFKIANNIGLTLTANSEKDFLKFSYMSYSTHVL